MNNASINNGQGGTSASQQATQNAVQNASSQQAAETSLSALPAAQALELFVQDPVGFVHHIAVGATESSLADLKEEAELRGALTVFRRTHPEFQRFESFILQEVVSLLQNDPESGTDPWDKLLKKAVASFKEKFAAQLKEGIPLKNDTPEPQPPFVEGAANRIMAALPPSFSRAQIAKMSMEEFLKNETAINDALKNNRVR